MMSMKCPFCHRKIDLRECPVIATNFSGAGRPLRPPSGNPAGLFADLSATEKSEETPERGMVTLASGGAMRLGSHGYPVLRDPTKEKKKGRFASAFRGPVDLGKFDSIDRPARLCRECEFPLPDGVGERDIITIAVVGPQGSGKSHFLASALVAAYRDQAMIDLGFETFYPVGDSERRLHDYFERVFEERKALDKNQSNDAVRHQPLEFSVSRDGQIATLLLHDVAGEDLMEAKRRNTVAPFVNHADGIIFMIDPWGLKSVRERIGDKYPDAAKAAAGYTQTSIVNSIADDRTRIDRRLVEQVPAAFAISKSDLISEALGIGVDKFKGGEKTASQRVAEIHDISTMIRGEVLEQLGERSLISAMSRFEAASLHLVAAIGSQPGPDERVTKLEPSRVTDPLFSVLERIMG
jgi:hypothetical protein